jgi:hypothetical protein
MKKAHLRDAPFFYRHFPRFTDELSNARAVTLRLMLSQL